jgi:RNA polymerase sigma-70 factor (ECF subfamily)
MDACAVVSPASVDDTTGFASDLAALRPFLLKRAIHLTNKRELAEDLVQTTFARALQASAQFTPGTNLKGWVATILHHEFYSYHRRSWRSASWSDEIAATLSSPLGEQESALDLQQVACALNDLPEGQREALVAIGLLGFAYEEVAALFDCSTGTVKSRVSRARIGLMEAVQARRASGRRLIPASPRAFAQWLADLEAIRIAACARLAGEAPADAKLPTLRKIALKRAAAGPTLRFHKGALPVLAPAAFTAAAA